MSKKTVAIVGGGHAGVEAALAISKIGLRCILVTLKSDAIGRMSCNPAIGGLAKGHLVKEIDALDGIMARAADEAGIQFRLLNRSRGAAVRGNRCQADRKLYKKSIQGMLSSEPSLKIYSGTVIEFIKSTKGSVKGVKLETGEKFCSEATILTTGTFLNGMIHIGTKAVSAVIVADLIFEVPLSIAPNPEVIDPESNAPVVTILELPAITP